MSTKKPTVQKQYVILNFLGEVELNGRTIYYDSFQDAVEDANNILKSSSSNRDWMHIAEIIHTVSMNKRIKNSPGYFKHGENDD